MEIVRINDLKNAEGENIFEAESEGLVKEAAFYLNEKTKDLSDDEYIDWLKNKIKKGFFVTEDRLTLGDDLFTNEKFLFLQKDYELLPIDIVTVLDLAIEQNGLKEKEYKYLIDSY